MNDEEFKARLLEWRDIRTPCDDCQGSGTKMYGNTATWRYGMGGNAMTTDVCDKCWGSGDKERSWTDLRLLDKNKETEIRRRVAKWMHDSLGMYLNTLHPALNILATNLEKQSRGRKEELYDYYLLCSVFAKEIRRVLAAIQENKVKE